MGYLGISLQMEDSTSGLVTLPAYTILRQKLPDAAPAPPTLPPDQLLQFNQQVSSGHQLCARFSAKNSMVGHIYLRPWRDS